MTANAATQRTFISSGGTTACKPSQIKMPVAVDEFVDCLALDKQNWSLFTVLTKFD